MRRFLTAAVFGLVALWPAGQAFAHAQLESSTPANGEALATSPSELVFDFNEAVSLEFGAVTLTDERGDAIDIPAPELRATDVVAVKGLPALPDGQYVVGYTVVSADGHPVSGNIVFRVGAGAVDTSAAGPQAAPTMVNTVYGIVRFATYPPLVALVGIPLFALTVWSPLRTRARRPRRWAAAAMCAATLAQFVLAVPYLSRGGWSDAWSPGQWWTLAGTATGAWLVVRFLAAAAALFDRAAIPAALVVAASFVGEGHSGAHGWLSVVAGATLVHIAAMGLWLCGLVAITWGIRRDDQDLLVASLRRWSPVAMTAVAALAVTGVVQALSARPDGASFSTDYLATLLTKVGLVALMIVLGALGRRSLQRRASGSSWPHALRRSVAVELVLATLVLVATTVLSQTEPGALAAPANSAAVQQRHPQTLVIALGDRTMTVLVDDMAVGRRAMDVTLDDTARPFTDPLTLQARLSLPEQGLGPIPILFDTESARHWTSAGVEIPADGTWQLEIFVVDAATKARFSTTVVFHPEGEHHDQ